MMGHGNHGVNIHDLPMAQQRYGASARGAAGHASYMFLTIASPKPEQLTFVAPSIWRSRS
jgi:hypothetical protein